MSTTYVVTDRAGKFVRDMNEATFIKLTEQEVVLDATWDKHLIKFGHEVFTNANSDYVLIGETK